MADIKRPNYFTSQFLVEKDFNDEQAYHLGMRRRLNRMQHTSGVADGLAVTRVSATQVQVSAGTAIDKGGREIVLEEAQLYTLATAGNNLDVYLTLSYQEVPVDHYNQGGLDKYTRTAERPLLLDGTAAPPTDGSVILLARIHLNSSGAIVSDGSIDTTVRMLAGARLAPKSVGVTQLMDGAVTLAKLADEALPLAVQGTNAITVTTDTVQKKVTVGESHSTLTTNPHATTAQQIDTQGGTNRIVAQINAGTGTIARSRVEMSTVTGVVTFTNLGASEQFSGEIDPGLGAGPLCVQLAIDEVVGSVDMTIPVTGDFGKCRAEVNRTSGRFRIFAERRSDAPAAIARVRWFAFKPVTGTDSSVSVIVTVTPPTRNLGLNGQHTFSATVLNSTNSAVIWSTNGGTVATSGLYTAPSTGTGATYEVKATSVADGTKAASAIITFTTQIAVNISQTTANLVTGGQLTLSANAINTGNQGINWSIQNNAGGTLLSQGSSATYTAPTTPGTYTVIAASAANTAKTAQCAITVSAPTFVAQQSSKVESSDDDPTPIVLTPDA